MAVLVADLAGGTVCPGVIACHPRPVAGRTVRLRPDRARRLLGARIDTARMIECLADVDLPARKSGEALSVEVPTSRRDITREVDLLEEVARLEGYDKVEAATACGAGVAAGVGREGRERPRARESSASENGWWRAPR